MKKLIASLAVAFLLSAGLVAGSTTTATAGPYSGTVSTIITANAADSRQGQALRVRVNVRAARGNGTPRGPVSFTIANRRTGKSEKVYTRFYNGTPHTYKFRTGLPRGQYIIIVTYIGRSNSVYRSSSTVDDFTRLPRR